MPIKPRNTFHVKGPESGLNQFLIRAGAWSMVVKIVSAFLVFLIAVILARSLGTDGYGAYSFALALILLVSVPVHAGMTNLVVRETAKGLTRRDIANLSAFWKWSRHSVFFQSIIGLLIIAAFVVFSTGEMMKHRSAALLVGFALLPIMTFGALFGGTLRGLGNVILGQLGDSLIRPLVFISVFSIWLYLSEYSPMAWHAMIAHALGALVALAVSYVFLRLNSPPNLEQVFSTVGQRAAWRRALLPLTLLGGLNVVNAQIDILMLGFFRPDEEVGVYQAVLQLVMLVVFTMNALKSVVQPHIARLVELGDMPNLQKLLTFSARVVFIVGLGPSLALLFFGDYILSQVFGADFAAGSAALAILSIGKLCYIALGFGVLLLPMAGYEDYTLKITIGAVALNCVLNVALIPLFGIEGAAAANAVTYVVWNIVLRYYASLLVGVEMSLRPIKKLSQ